MGESLIQVSPLWESRLGGLLVASLSDIHPEQKLELFDQGIVFLLIQPFGEGLFFLNVSLSSFVVFLCLGRRVVTE